MTNPTEPAPFAQPDPWHGQRQLPPQPGSVQQPPQHYAPQQQFPTQSLPPQQLPGQQWQSYGSAGKPGNALAITALVIASVALLAVLGLIAFVFLSGFSSAPADLQGTAPGVVASQAYPGDLLENEVARVIGNDFGDVESMTCPDTSSVDADMVTVCHGVVDGYDSQITVTFEDDLGHFTLVEN